MRARRVVVDADPRDARERLMRPDEHLSPAVILLDQPRAISHAPRNADELAAAWLLGFKTATSKAYAADLAGWSQWLQSVGAAPLDAHRAHVDAYARTLERQSRAPATIARKLSVLSGFYAYAVDEALIGRSPVTRVRRPKAGQDSQTLGLDREEMRAFIAAAAEPRDRALALLLTLNGLRISEALWAHVEELGEERGHRTLSVVRKGERRQLVPLAPMTADAIDAYLGERVTGPLFITSSGRPMDRHAAAKVVGRIARQAGIIKKITPHSLRHSFVTAALDAGASLRDVQDAAGHASPVTTRRYDRSRHNLDRHPTYAVSRNLA